MQVGPSAAQVRRWTRLILLGPDNSWGARLATGQTGIYVLAALAVVVHALDLATGLRMMLTYGISLEQNPLARFLMLNLGPLGLATMKLLVVVGGVLVFVKTARLGRARLARNCLLVAVAIGVLGAASNLIG